MPKLEVDEFSVPAGWKLCSFGDLFDFKGGSQPPKSSFIHEPKDGYIRLLQIRDFESDKYPAYIEKSSKWPQCEAEDILIARYGASLGRICSGKSGAYNVALVKVLFDKDKLCRDWVELFLKSSWFQEPLFLVSRSAQSGFNKKEVLPRPVPLPPLNEQQRIVAKIEELTDRTRKAREALEDVPQLIEQFRRSVLAAAFRGDLTADWRAQNPDVEPAEKLLERSTQKLAQKNRQLDLSVSRDKEDLPCGWSWSKLGSFINRIQAGKNFSCPEEPVTRNTVGLVKISAVTWGKFDPKETKTVTDSDKIDQKLFIQKGDFLISRANTIELVGSSVVVGDIEYQIMLSDKVWRVDFEEVHPKYVHYFLKSSQGRKEIESRATGNQLSMRNISQNAFKDIVIPVPPLEEQIAIVRHIESALTRIQSVGHQRSQIISVSEQLDRAILAKAFRGELVPQDPTDEPASQLLQRIRRDREKTNPKQTPTTKRTARNSQPPYQTSLDL